MTLQSRFAGKALTDFLKIASSAVSGAVSEAVINKLKPSIAPDVPGAKAQSSQYARGMQQLLGLPPVEAKETGETVKDATGIFGFAAKHPEMIGKLTGAVAGPLTIAGGAAGLAAGSAALGNMFNPSGGVYSGSNYSLPVQQQAAMGRAPSFAGQRYMPGSSPLTNEQMGESLLEQQKFQHQLQLIQARNSTHNYDGSLGSEILSGGGGVGDIMKQIQQTLNTSTVYK